MSQGMHGTGHTHKAIQHFLPMPRPNGPVSSREDIRRGHRPNPWNGSRGVPNSHPSMSSARLLVVRSGSAAGQLPPAPASAPELPPASAPKQGSGIRAGIRSSYSPAPRDIDRARYMDSGP